MTKGGRTTRRNFHTHVGHLERLWQEFDETPPKHGPGPAAWRVLFSGEDDELYVDQLDVPISQLVREDGSLGSAARCLLLVHYLTDGSKAAHANFFADVLLHVPDANVDEINVQHYQRILKLANKDGKTGTYQTPVIDGLVAWIREMNGTTSTKVDSTSLFERRFGGKSAIVDFLHFLGMRDVTFQPFLPSDRPETSPSWIDRMAGTIDAFVAHGADTPQREVDGQGRSPAYMQVGTGDLWSAQIEVTRALVQKMKHRGETRNVLVLPVAGYRRRDTAPGAPPRIEFPDVPTTIARLLYFVEGSPDPDAIVDVPPLADHDSVHDAIGRIRLAMLKDPVVIIFTGVDSACVDRPATERAIADNDAFRVVSRLLDVPLVSCGVSDVLKRWGRSCIVVFSDSADTSFLTGGAMQVPERIRTWEVAGSDEDAPVMTDEEWRDWIPEIGLVYPDRLASYGTELGRTYSELAIRMADAILVLEHGLDEQGTERLDATLDTLVIRPLHAQARDWSHLGTLVRKFVELLRDRQPLWYSLLALIVQAPDGLRRRTLCRIVDRMDEPSIGSARKPLLLDCIDIELHALVGSLPYLVAEIGSDQVDGAENPRDLVDGPRTSDDGSDGERGPPASGFAQDEERPVCDTDRPLALQFSFTRLRHLIRDEIARDIPRAQFHHIHAAMANEAIEQQTAVLRYADINTSLSIRMWRRQFSVLYHGLLSLEVTDLPPGETRADSHMLVALKEGELNTGALSDGSKSFWRWLYFFAFRRQLERAPAFNLSRQYGEDKLKSELLSAFDQPWMWWPPFHQAKESMHGEASLVATVLVPDEPVLALVTHREARARTCLALGDDIGLDEVLRDLGRMGEWLETSSDKSAEADGRLIRLILLRYTLELHTLGIGEKASRTQSNRLGVCYRGIYEELGKLKALEPLHALQHEARGLRDRWVAGTLVSTDGSTDQAPISIRCPAARRFVDSLFESGWSERQVSVCVDLFNRLAALHAIESDLRDMASSTEPSKTPSFDLYRVDRYRPARERHRAYATTLAVFVQSESMRLRLFERQSGGSNYFASGHATRQMIRTALELHSWRERSKGKGPARGDSPFMRFAMQQADTLTRHLFRYPREKASILLVEADIVRIGTRARTRAAGLAKAQELIGRAEKIVLGLGREMRLRLRLASQRCLVHAELAMSGEHRRSRYRHLCAADVVYLENHPTVRKLLYWRRVAERRRQLLDCLDAFSAPFVAGDHRYVRRTSTIAWEEGLSANELNALGESLFRIADGLRSCSDDARSIGDELAWKLEAPRFDKLNTTRPRYRWTNPPVADSCLTVTDLEQLAEAMTTSPWSQDD